ncbi:Pentatricopeptide repeat-containing protein [Acorus gramineus]|uniref:Pentatricopeptide repeat-containing protein n=1 Tax=Acorus gramineus TaxID=55184 RepID=A0AAV9A6X4_ACOGR|nr:Pentatricopeptide repeat-containing protein [Acorus gramineus]
MRRSDVPPDTHTFPFVLTACSRLPVPSSLGPAIHSQSLRFGLAGDLFVRNTLMKVYSNHGSVADARQMFDESPVRDAFSHNTIIDVYVKIGELGIARRVFDAMPCRDVVSWGTLLSGYARMGLGEEAIGLFDRMLVAALSACAQIGALDRGRAIHEYIGRRSPVSLNVYVSTALVDMYAKCGCMDLAREVFEASLYKNVFTWNAMVVGFAMHGHGELSVEYFYRMLKGSVRPDGVSFLGVLVGCSHAGLVDTAHWIFDQMEGVYGVRRELKHYGCMADLMGRAGLIEEVLDMIKGMPMEADAFVWGGLLGGCRIYGNVEVAEIAFKRLMELGPDDSGIYTVMANVYANAERWDDVGRMRRLLDARGVKKNVGCSSVRREFAAVDDDE